MGQFEPTSQKDSVPTSLKALISHCLYGPNIKEQVKDESQIALSIAELLYFNSKKKDQKEVSTSFRHSKEREPPLPIYVSMMIHRETRSKKIINLIHSLGLSISYWRLLEIEKHIASSVCEHFAETNIVIPTNSLENTFVVAGIDNINFDGSSNTGQNSFHGTSISLHQQRTESSVERPKLSLTSQQYKIQLPDSYANVPPLNNVNSKPPVPLKTITTPFYNLDEQLRREQRWVQQSQLLMLKDLQPGDMMSWSGYNSKLAEVPPMKPSVTGMLPIFEEKASSYPMMAHGLKVICEAVQKLNPGQIPVITADQPLFALLKILQWQNPLYSEESGYHIRRITY